MYIKVWKYLVLMCLLTWVLPAKAQRFFNLTSPEVRVDSVLPHFVYSIPLEGTYRDSIYSVSLKYGEYIDMTASDIEHYNRLSGAALPDQVNLRHQVVECRKKGSLMVDFCPLVFRNNRYQLLVSFMLQVDARALKRSEKHARMAQSGGKNSGPESIYAEHSVLASGKWAKIKVAETGFHELTEQVVRQAGFTDINRVKIYGYGGNLQNEALSSTYLRETDDLREVPQCIVDGRHYFYAKGPVGWESNHATRRIRNPYSDFGYYLITQTDEELSSVDSTTFVSTYYPLADDYHSLYEADGFSWYAGGRNLFDAQELKVGAEQKVRIANATGSSKGTLTVALTSGNSSKAQILKNGSLLGEVSLSVSDSQTESAAYVHGVEKFFTYSVDDFSHQDTISVKLVSGSPIHLDYVSVVWNQPKKRRVFGSGIPAAQYVYGITNQDHHADGAADMVIIVPTSQKLMAQAERLKAFHETHDGLRVNIVPADELYNEFSSGTPDANAYRRYLRMLTDRAQTEADMPKYLLLFGDCVWDNRMLTSTCRGKNADDYLLCYESENSFSAVSCYVSDSWLGILGEGTGLNPRRELQDVAVGRFPVVTEEEAKVLVDKTISYASHTHAGAWQNTLVFMGDDGNNNQHMMDANEVADDMQKLYPGYWVKKVMWDAYKRETSSVGNTYPEVTKMLKQQQANGALVMDYAGHGSSSQISHEAALTISDFDAFRNTNLPLWVTASCDIMPFDGVEPTIGEHALLNEQGGAVAFYGTTRTVYAQQNKYINRAFMRRVLSRVDGKPITIGEAHRLAQNDVMTGRVIPAETDVSVNHLQYSLLGDPALSLNLPACQVIIDSINGVAVDADGKEKPLLKAGSVAKVAGHIEGMESFQGVMTATVRDSEVPITCRLNDTSKTGADTPFVYNDRTKTIYQGSDSVLNGRFAFSFAVPKDINYSNQTGLMNIFAVTADKTQTAHGAFDHFIVGESEENKNDSIGPSIFCYLNSPSFVDGGSVNTTPFFVAKVSDKDGINAAGTGIGHDLQLVVDGDLGKTYVLNDNFAYDFGTYQSGTTFYSIPELSPGQHQLTFRAWDIMNNSSTTTLHFQVVRGLMPTLIDVGVTENPARNSTTFIISHDRTGSEMDVIVEVFDMGGKLLWHHVEKGLSASGNYMVKWNLTQDDGRPIGMGVYLYRVRVSADGSRYTSKTRKLIVNK